MDPHIPVDIVEAIIDQAADDPRSLCQLALTCSQLLPRSRYHLLARHVCLRNKSQLEEFYVYLCTNPHMRPSIRVVKLLVPSDIPEEEALKTRGLLSMIPVPLLTLPNLRYWGIQYREFPRDVYCLGFGPPQLACLRAYTTSIMTLDLHNIGFLNVTEFTRFLFAFPALRSLKLCGVRLWNDVMGITFGPARERLAKQLHLTSLHMKEMVHQSVIALLLEIGRSTVEDLEFGPMPSDVLGKDHLHDLVCDMQALRSITTIMGHSRLDDVDETVQFLVDGWETMMRLPTSPSRTYTTRVNTVAYVDSAFTNEAVVEKGRQLEQFLLGQTSHGLVLSALDLKRRRESFWMTALGRYFPELHRRGQLRVEGDKFSDAYEMTGHDNWISCLAVSLDSEWIASGSWDTTIILWDAQRGSIVQEWLSCAGRVNCLAFSPDSHLLASGGGHGSIAIWDVNEECKQVATLCGHTEPVFTCAWSPDRPLLGSGDGSGSVRVWDTQSFIQLHYFENAAKGWFPYVCFSPDLRWFASWGKGGYFKVWNTSDGRLHKTLHADVQHVSRVAFDPTGRRIVISISGYILSVWDVKAGEELLVLRGHQGHVQNVAFSPNGNWVLSASSDGTVKMWDSHTGELVHSFEGHTGTVYSACFSPDGKYVASASVDTTMRLWRTSDGSCVRIFTEHTDWVMHVLFSPDGETLCSGAKDGTVFIRHLRDIIA